jgi:hypothetical protein
VQSKKEKSKSKKGKGILKASQTAVEG